MNSPHNSDAIIFLLGTLGIGGSEKKTVRLVNALHEMGWPIHLLYLNAPDTLLSEVNRDVPTAALDRVGKFSISTVWKLRSYISRYRRVTFVSVNLYPCIYAFAVTRISNKVRVKNVVAVNTTDHQHLKHKIQMIVYAPLLRRADGVVFGCHSQLRKWVSKFGFDANQCHVIYNGVDDDYCSPERDYSSGTLKLQFGIQDSDIVVGTVGNLRPEKNHVGLVRAIEQVAVEVPNIRAIIVGEGPERARIEEAIRAANLDDRVILMGEIDDVRQALELMDIFVLPSIAVETFSNAALEAMAMGRALVMSDIGGAREMIEDGTTGHVFTKGDQESLVNLLKTLANDERRRCRLGVQARAVVQEKFSFRKMVREYERLF